MDEQTQQRLETLLSAGIGMALSRLVAERFIKDAVPEQRGIKDDITRAVLRATSGYYIDHSVTSQQTIHNT